MDQPFGEEFFHTLIHAGTEPISFLWQGWGYLGAPRRRAVVVLAPRPRPGPGRMAQGLPGGWQVHARQRAGLGPGGSWARRATSGRPRLRLCIFPWSRQLGLRLWFLSST